MATIGTILKDRIKECGYTQEEFAEKSGIGLSTLKKQMNDKIAYRYDDLMKYAELLNCSYDYLLGYSKSPQREYHEIIEKTHLSIESIEHLEEWAKKDISETIGKYRMMILNKIICHPTFLDSMSLYCGANKMLRESVDAFTKKLIDNMGMNMENESLEMLNTKIDSFYLIGLMQDIDSIKDAMRKPLLDEMRESLASLNTIDT